MLVVFTLFFDSASVLFVMCLFVARAASPGWFVFVFLVDRLAFSVLSRLYFLLLFFFLLRFIQFDGDGQAINLSLVHAQYGSLCFFFGGVVDHRVVFGSTDST
jgi:hypothetical protein